MFALQLRDIQPVWQIRAWLKGDNGVLGTLGSVQFGFMGILGVPQLAMAGIFRFGWGEVAVRHVRWYQTVKLRVHYVFCA